MNETLMGLAGLTASVLFVLALRGLSHPRTAVRGNLLGAGGMVLIVLVTLFDRRILSWELILLGLAAGAAFGLTLAIKIRTAAMPQLVALFNGLGGGASALVAGAALNAGSPESALAAAGLVSGWIGSVTFSGSGVALAKLQGWLGGAPARFHGRRLFQLASLVLPVIPAVFVLRDPADFRSFAIMLGLALLLGTVLVLPIGGADMPVVIALLNACSGLAAAATGFVVMNPTLIIAGSLVGSSGFILTTIMCRAMNRSLLGVLFGDAVGLLESEEAEEAGVVKSISAEEVAMVLEAARRVVIVPGYGMAAAQAQQVTAELGRRLESKGIDVQFAIHPVAGRMPGHMNVLLAEANVPYERLRDLDEINPLFVEADVALVIGANDVVNPSARSDPKSPIAGMPILDVDRARTVIIVKRGMGAGFAGVRNPLFTADNAVMLFGDAKTSLRAIVDALE